MEETIEIYAAGASLGEPGPGGYAAVIDPDNQRHTVQGHEAQTNRERMEITAVLEALRVTNEISPPGGVKAIIHSRSQNLTEAFNQGLIAGWETEGMEELPGVPAQKPGPLETDPRHSRRPQNHLRPPEKQLPERDSSGVPPARLQAGQQDHRSAEQTPGSPKGRQTPEPPGSGPTSKPRCPDFSPISRRPTGPSSPPPSGTWETPQSGSWSNDSADSTPSRTRTPPSAP